MAEHLWETASAQYSFKSWAHPEMPRTQTQINTEAAFWKCFWIKVFGKYAANLQENTHAEVFLRTLLEGCFCQYWISLVNYRLAVKPSRKIKQILFFERTQLLWNVDVTGLREKPLAHTFGGGDILVTLTTMLSNLQSFIVVSEKFYPQFQNSYFLKKYFAEEVFIGLLLSADWAKSETKTAKYFWGKTYEWT